MCRTNGSFPPKPTSLWDAELSKKVEEQNGGVESVKEKEVATEEMEVKKVVEEEEVEEKMVEEKMAEEKEVGEASKMVRWGSSSD